MTAKEILKKHTKSNGCRISLQENPFLEQAILNAINEAINYSRCCKSDSDKLPSFLSKRNNRVCVNVVEDADVTEHWNDFLKTR